jgi:hypothetical protein
VSSAPDRPLPTICGARLVATLPLLAAPLLLVIALTLPGTALAGVYQVQECAAPAFPGAPDALFWRSDGRFDFAKPACGSAAASLSLSARKARGGSAAWHFDAPPGTELAGGSRLVARIDEGQGLHGAVLGVSTTGAMVETSGGDTGGAFRAFALPGGRTYRSLQLRLRCARRGGCPATGRIRFRNVLLSVDDRSAPVVGTFKGPFDGSYHSGAQLVSFRSHDEGAGIRSAIVLVNGVTAASRDYRDCTLVSSYATDTTPCSSDRAGSFDLPASAFRDGDNEIRVCAFDFGGLPNRGCSQPRTVLVDRRAPANPRNLRVAGGDAWHRENDFSLSWEDESELDGAAIAGAVYRLTGPGGYDSGARFMAGASDGLQHLQVPAPGEYRIAVWLRDAAGNESEANAETATLRFDDIAPGGAALAKPAGWISRDELPYTLAWQPPEQAATPPSGIRGYVLAIDDEPLADPCGDGAACAEGLVNVAASATSVRLRNLGEGIHFAHLAAISGAGLESEVSHVTLRVDRTDPSTTLAGVPDGWTSRPVALTAHAADSLSGTSSDGDDDGAPITAIRVDGGPEQLASAPGDATAGIAGDGDHLVEIWARDLAGNANDGKVVNGVRHAAPESVHVRIDATAPAVALSPPATADGALIEAAVSDALSGVKAGEISFRPAGSSEPYRALPTELAGDTLRARFPSDSEPSGRYDVRATAEDVAGNSRTTRLRQDGSLAVFDNAGTSRTARQSGQSGVSRLSLVASPRKLRNGRTVRFSGVISPAADIPAGGKTLIVQYYDPARRRWRPVDLIRSDQAGGFSYAYRFRSIRSAQRILFRVSDLAESGWPHAPGTSPTVKVTVYP